MTSTQQIWASGADAVPRPPPSLTPTDYGLAERIRAAIRNYRIPGSGVVLVLVPTTKEVDVLLPRAKPLFAEVDRGRGEGAVTSSRKVDADPSPVVIK